MQTAHFAVAASSASIRPSSTGPTGRGSTTALSTPAQEIASRISTQRLVATSNTVSGAVIDGKPMIAAVYPASSGA